MAEALYRKYRPKTFAEVTEQAHVVTTLVNQLSQDKVTHAYLFSGPRGVGKTTLARLLAKALNCEQRASGSAEPCNLCANCLDTNAGRFLDMVEIDAASQTKVEETRENIIENVRFAPSRGRYKVFIIDEAHMLSSSSFNALLKTLEEPKDHAVFILATTELHKLPATIISRCQRFDFHRIPAKEMIMRLSFIAKTEGVRVDDEVLAAIARLSEGCMRDAESLLGQILTLNETHITLDLAGIIIPASNLEVVRTLADTVTHRHTSAALAIVQKFVEEGGSIPHFVDEFMEYVRAMLFKSLSGPDDDQYDQQTLQQLSNLSKRLSPIEHQQLLDLILSARGRSTPSQYPQLPLEIALVKFCCSAYELPRPGDDPMNKPTMSSRGNEGSEDILPSAPDVQHMPKLALSRPRQAQPPVTQSSTQAGDIYQVTNADIDDLQSKWHRCVALLGESNVAFPLILTKAEFLRVEDGRIVVALQYAIQVAKMNELKNLRLIEDAVAQVTMKPLRLSFRHIQTQADEAVTDILEVFGGAVV